MSIWKGSYTLEILNSWSKDTMLETLGIEFTELGTDFLRLRMPVDHRTRQPYGVLHGGASCVLAETAGSTAGNLCLEAKKQFCYGLSIQTNHIKTIKEGYITATARPIHLGRTTQVWEIDIRDEKEQLISINRLTNIIMMREI